MSLSNLTRRSASSLAEAIRRREVSSEEVVRGWLTRALTAPRGPQWVCDSCNHIHAEWAPVCEHCASFDTLSWKRPETPEVASHAAAYMLPLITGVLGSKQADTADDAQEADRVFDILMGTDVTARKSFIQSNAKTANLDI